MKILFEALKRITKRDCNNLTSHKLHASVNWRLFAIFILKYKRHLSHNLSLGSAPGTQRFNVLARLQFGAYLCRLTVIEVLKIIVKTVD